MLNEDNSDAEAHWGVAISRFGVEYVEDPGTHERVPTLHRVQFESILADADYQAALEHATDMYTRSLYEKEATAISEIQKGILDVSRGEKPFDVFICYKETSESGTRTKDSALAQDIYYKLAEAGYRVFFSRITLEDKLGTAYEPYIFSALNSAKVMLVVGTKAEHFNAVWVKNEWSRYLAIMKKDKRRVLIPCYQGMDAYDLPEQLSFLQSQDMSKIGFIQDLLRGVQKVLDASKATPKSQTSATDTDGATVPVPGIVSLHKRMSMFLENGEWKQAEEYANRILDIEPEYASAYVGLLCAEVHAKNESELPSSFLRFHPKSENEINANKHYVNAMRFADRDLRARLEDFVTIGKELKELKEAKRLSEYEEAIRIGENTNSPDTLSEVASTLKRLDYPLEAQKYEARAITMSLMRTLFLLFALIMFCILMYNMMINSNLHLN
ncbi:MAG: toll/interleukin-1 receptor domain-containing protein [Clostridiales bacterium]|jgi:tetratricopeptide (TPR) repeat protein|nr:toll/interleukin-1 receptor domain-containing protein [Clostridiales bacterium]